MRYSELKGIRPGTVKFYEQKLSRFFQWSGDQPIDEVSVDGFKATSCRKVTRRWRCYQPKTPLIHTMEEAQQCAQVLLWVVNIEGLSQQ